MSETLGAFTYIWNKGLLWADWELFYLILSSNSEQKKQIYVNKL